MIGTLPSGVLAMTLADARLPSGGHAHSAGMEPALLAGLPAAEALPLALARARTTSLVEAGTAVVARHLARSGEDLAPVEAAWAARTPAPSMRDAARVLGRGYLRLALRLWPDDPALRSLPRTPARAVVIGAMAAAAGTGADELVRTVVYDEAACAAAALLKLEPGDPVLATELVLRVCAATEPEVSAVAALTDPADIPAGSTPQAEEWAQVHAVTNKRLFRA
ncbi:Putative urease accessory protein OS=Tsukamurella paurometabola (strain ATCC 8368 / DSM / CCUG 35730 / CIP 100753 / JCM 10117 / KCTC 9821 / NBRC 16120 /NCIMB 702349 / NCTC 13040) OX=521096 GN=Tpau_3408 PE=4 SV=1 [Tsukamurella paurometabola]|uniref:Putative urease accessory protein n=1 Tax=Tsukamurella paurometabola (strain ATCC 8368 / DSM 20162 / CCUG 35730 / CIP 100753 / JCM 10117 / KCTC 9821 / NBRC 16120 / NCIMB 702349 / NCTC 13040) TaxID=521096 RepID=D5UWJ3_TSUPD|nr:urease accessory UreF family protein [Tsukamurella paurometabola]ADG79992.1 putative urease accessory protein [Tsukamurella paurometabola DSM 20162]SUP37959.1 Urease accessory protein UreF [Tsukamurella paurometabola]